MGKKLEEKKHEATQELFSKLNLLFLGMNFMEIYDFMMINNHFNAAGIYIYSKNREEEYLKIIETGDEDLIRKLEIYLERMDTLDGINLKYKKVRDTLNKIQDATTIKQVKVLLDSLPNV